MHRLSTAHCASISRDSTLQKEVTAAHLVLELWPEHHPPDKSRPREKPSLWLSIHKPGCKEQSVCLVTSSGISQAGHLRSSETEFSVTLNHSFSVFNAVLHWSNALEMSEHCSIVPLFPSRQHWKTKKSKLSIDSSPPPLPSFSVPLVFSLSSPSTPNLSHAPQSLLLWCPLRLVFPCILSLSSLLLIHLQQNFSSLRSISSALWMIPNDSWKADPCVGNHFISEFVCEEPERNIFLRLWC